MINISYLNTKKKCVHYLFFFIIEQNCILTICIYIFTCYTKSKLEGKSPIKPPPPIAQSLVFHYNKKKIIIKLEYYFNC